jgi:Domain of unknown function (DUF4159)/TAT (twin-arginine translocation) pathway signal sequence
MNRTLSRRTVLKAAGALAATPLLGAYAGPSRFTFARLRYQSGDWDVDPQMPANLLNSLVEYTRVLVDPREQVVALDSTDVSAFPFVYLTGHGLVRFTRAEKENFGRYVQDGGFVFVDDCNHDVTGLFAQSFEREMADLFPGQLRSLPNTHPLYSAAFLFPDGPPATHHELNGWGDNLVHEHLQAVSVAGKVGVLYSNKDYGCEWDYDLSSKQYLAEDNTKFGINIITHALVR